MIFQWLSLLGPTPTSNKTTRIDPNKTFFGDTSTPKTPEKGENVNHSKTQPRGSAEIDKTEERILLYLYQNERTEVAIEELQVYLSEIGDDTVNYYIEELRKNKYLKKSRKFSFVWIDDKGKKYLTENKLIDS